MSTMNGSRSAAARQNEYRTHHHRSTLQEPRHDLGLARRVEPEHHTLARPEGCDEFTMDRTTPVKADTANAPLWNTQRCLMTARASRMIF
jgi:hypothetical protein